MGKRAIFNKLAYCYSPCLIFLVEVTYMKYCWIYSCYCPSINCMHFPFLFLAVCLNCIYSTWFSAARLCLNGRFTNSFNFQLLKSLIYGFWLATICYAPEWLGEKGSKCILVDIILSLRCLMYLLISLCAVLKHLGS